jgi:Sulfotransferase family
VSGTRASWPRRAAAATRGGAIDLVRAGERTARIPGDRRTVQGPRFADGSRRIYHHHVRKTGGTSLNRAFLGLGDEDPARVHWRMRGALHATRSNGRVFIAHDASLLGRGYYTYGWHHAPSWSLTLPPETFTITVLRDPINRVLSLYRYLLDPGADDDQPFKAGRDERLRAAGGFESFLRLTPREDLLNQLHMFSPRFDPAEAAEGVRACSAWFMTERLGLGIDELNQRLGLELQNRWDRRSRADDGLRAQHEELLRRVLAPEYELLRLLQVETEAPSRRGSERPQGTQLPRRS